MQKDNKYYEALGRYGELREEYDKCLNSRNELVNALADTLNEVTAVHICRALDIEKTDKQFHLLKEAEIRLVDNISKLNKYAEICGKPGSSIYHL